MQGIDTHPVAVIAAGAQHRQHAIEVGQCVAGGVGQLPAFRGERHPARVALEQGNTEPRFQLAHVVADRTGGQVQLLAGVGEILVPRRRFERCQRRQPVASQCHG